MSEILSLTLKDKHAAPNNSSQVGQIGEELAAVFLRKNGYRIVAANFTTTVGRGFNDKQISGEIDLIALDADVLCFVEVKTRTSDEFASPFAAVDLRKQRQIIRTAKMYRRIFRLSSINFRYDVVGIVLAKKARPEIELVKNYFTEEKFQKKNWAEEM